MAGPNALGSMTFCTDRTLGMGLHIDGQTVGRFHSDFDFLDEPRQLGEFPPWFKEYMKAAEQTKCGLLILQLTASYVKPLGKICAVLFCFDCAKAKIGI